MRACLCLLCGFSGLAHIASTLQGPRIYHHMMPVVLVNLPALTHLRERPECQSRTETRCLKATIMIVPAGSLFFPTALCLATHVVVQCVHQGGGPGAAVDCRGEASSS
jgi:hypothetical protein